MNPSNPFSTTGSCCGDPMSAEQPVLVNMGLAPGQAPGVCSGVDPQQSSSPTTFAPCSRGVPCCAAPKDLTAFLNGNTYPIAVGQIRFFVGNSALQFPPNPTIIANDAALVAYLNSVSVLGFAASNGLSIDGPGSVFSIPVSGSLVGPRINGTCSYGLQNIFLTVSDQGPSMLVLSSEGAQPGDILAPSGLNPPVGGGGGAGLVNAARTGRRSIVRFDVPGQEVIATLAVATVTANPIPPQADGWAIVDPNRPIQRGAVGNYDRVPVLGPGDTFVPSDLGNGPRRAMWDALRNPSTGSPTGAFVSADPGVPITGPAAIMQPDRFTVGQVVISPRVAVPFDLLRPEGRVNAYRLTVPAPSDTVATVPGQGGAGLGGPTPPAPAAQELPPIATASSVATTHHKKH